jgi:hypothetical protein
MLRSSACGLVVLSLIVPRAFAGEADVVEARIVPEASGTYRFDVTVRHDDEGWGHYADGWEIVASDGSVLATRTLLHPHVDEQPFTRSLSGVELPQGISEVTIRAHDKVHGYGGEEVAVPIPN